MIKYEEMTKNCITEMTEIEKQCFNSKYPEKMFEKELENKISYYIVARDGAKIVGYGGAWIVLDEADIMSIAVHKDFRRRNIGEGIVNKLTEHCVGKRVKFINLEVRKSNVAAQRLYEKTGFKTVGERKKYYDNTEDAILMRKEV